MAMVTKKKDGATSGPPKISPVIKQILRDCTREGTQAVLLWSDLMHLSKATFAEVDEETFALANPSGIKTSLLDPSLPITVTFHYLGRVFTFVTWFVIYTQQGPGEGPAEEGTPPWLVLQVPTRIAATDSRTAARIKVLPTAPFRMELTGPDDKVHPMQATEISLTGIVAEGAESDPKLKVDAKVVIKMGLEETLEPSQDEKERAKADKRDPVGEVVWKPIKIESIVRAVDGGKYNLYFPVCLTSDGIKPPQPLRQVVMGLERIYLQHRAAMEEGKEEE